MTSVLDAAMNAMRPAAIAKRISLERQYEPALPPALADPHRLEQVFRNLIATQRGDLRADQIRPSRNFFEQAVLTPNKAQAAVKRLDAIRAHAFSVALTLP